MSGMDGATIRAMPEQHFTSGDPRAEIAMGCDGGPWHLGVSILELRDEVPEWRAQWRSAP